MKPILILFLASAASAWAADDVLFDFSQPFDPARVRTQDASAGVTNDGGRKALQVETRHNVEWPGITLAAPSGRWDLLRWSHLSVNCKNTGSNAVTVNCRVDNPGADGTKNCVGGSTELAPGRSGTIDVPLTRTAGSDLGGKLFGMRGYPAEASTQKAATA